jgi:putative ABC transport system permease protein
MAASSGVAQWRDELTQDIRFALRSLARNPAFTAVAVLTLALGIGANGAIFSVVNGVLLKPLPFPQPQQLLRAWQNSTGSTSTQRGVVSAMNLDDWRARRGVIADMGGYWYAEGQSGTDMTGVGEPQRLAATFVTPGFWNTLAVPAAIGRVPRDDEMVRGSNDKVVVLSRAFWERQFGASRTVIGQRMTLGGDSYEIVGVMPESFRFPSPRVDVYIPFSTIPDASIPRLRPVRILSVVARMRPGVTVAQANAELNGIARALADEYPENRLIAAASVAPLQDAIVGKVRTSLFVLLGAVGFVLLIASVNLASLLLARASTRERELAVRAALGAERARLVRQLFTESLVLAGAGGIAGVIIAKVGGALLLRLAAGQLPRAEDVGIDARVLAFTVAISVLTGLIFGLVPAIRASSPALQESLREGTRGSTRGTGGLRSALVVAEVALAMVLVIGAGLMTRSFIKLLQIDLGFSTDHRLALNYSISTSRHGHDAELRDTYRRMLDAVRAAPGVLAAGAVRDLPFRGEGEPMSFLPPGGTPGPNGERPVATLMFTSDGFFSAMGIPLVAGRDLSPQDRQGAPPVFVINQALAKKYFPNQNPVGQTLIFGDSTRMPIVGVVGDVRQTAVDEAPVPRIYASVYQIFRVKVNLVIRTRENPTVMIKRVEDAIRTVDPAQTFTGAFTLDEVVSEAVARPRLLTVLLGLFGAMGLVLGALGIYGVLAYLVTQRTREIGVRLALGAQQRDVLGMIVGSGLRLAAVGVAIGFVASLALTRLMQGVLYGVTPYDPLTFGGVAIGLVAVAALASWLPAMRATRVDPLEALRAE